MLIWEGRRVGGIALAMLASALLAGTAYAQPNPAQKALEEQGRYWEDRHQPARAAVAWQKLLESDANNAEALLHLGLIEARQGHSDKARAYAAQLKSSHPDARENVVLERAIAVGNVPVDTINEARRLARSGQFDAAVAAYKRALKNQPPPPDLAQEYYETLAGSKSGWEEARRGLQELSAAMPSNLSVQYGYARVLTYHEATRRQGIAMMASLAGDPSVGRQANQGWHDALLWLGATKEDIALYKNYMASHAGDAAVGKKLADLTNPAKQAQFGPDEAHTKALQALEAGRLKEAGEMFAALIKANPQDPDAYGGLGVVREREGNLHEARELLTRAVALTPQGETKWREALASAVYLDNVAQAKAALRAHRWKEAEAKAQEAMEHPVAGDTNAELVIAEVARQTKRWGEAEKIFRHVLEEQPHNREAASGLASVLVATGRAKEARHFAKTVPEAGPVLQPMDIARQQAAALAEQARAMVNRGDVRGAMAAYRDAMNRDPANPWFKLDYARLQTRVGDRVGADRTIAQMIAVTHPSGETLAAAAIWYGEHGDYQRAAQLARGVPTSTVVADFGTMSHQWIASSDAQQAIILARRGRLLEAHKILDNIIAGANGNVGVVGVAADAYVDIGDSQRAVNALRAVLGPEPTLDGQIQYAGVLLRVGAIDELVSVMHLIDTRSAQMRPAQQSRVADLHRGLSIKLADAARLKGDYAGAYDRLSPELAISRDATVLAALARIYESAGRHEDALEIYTRILRSDPTNMDARREIVGAAIVVGDYDRAHLLLTQGLVGAPNDPRLHLLAAELARAEGDDELALDELAKAQAELARRNGDIWIAPGEQYGYLSEVNYTGGNPFMDRDRWAAEHYRDRYSDYFTPSPIRRPSTQESQVYYSTYQSGPTYGYNPAYPVPEVGGRMAVTPEASEDQQLAQQVAEQIEQVTDPMRPYVQGGVTFRNIDGEQGLSQFSMVSLPITGGARVGPGVVTLQVEPTAATSGSLNNTDPGVFRRFGTNATFGPFFTGTAPAYEGTANGVGIKVGYTTNSMAAEVGTTPLGFPESNIIGHIVWSIPLDNQTSIKLTGFRDPVMDSLLAYAGTRDPLAGVTWGGVTRTGGRIDLGYDNGRTGVYGDVTAAYLGGDHVQSNWMVDAGGGAYWRFYRTEHGALKVGVNLQAQAYERNVDFYTYGNGGYFSPQTAVEATVPIEYSGRWGKLAYSVGGQIGVMDFHDKSQPYFPLDPNLQAIATGSGGTVPIFPGQSVTTAIYGITAKMEYEVAPLLVLGASFGADNSYNYNEQSLMVYLKKKFDTY
jgi:cellulose synthase operon protein C